MDNYLPLLFLHSSPVGLVITRYPEILVVVSIILWAYCLAVLCHLNTPMDNSRTYRVSAHPLVVHVFHNGLWKYYSILQESLVAYCSAILVCLHYGCFPYVWHYSLVSSDTVILILLIQHECECTQLSVDPFKLSFWLRRHFWTWACSRPIGLPPIVPLSLRNLSILNQSVCFWSLDQKS